MILVSKFRPWLLFIGCCALALTGFAQAPASDAPKPPKLRFLFIDESAGAYSLKQGSQSRHLAANPYEISNPFVSPDFKDLEIYKEFPAEVNAPTAQSRRVKIATVTQPKDTPSALVIITPRPPATPEATPVYQVEVIDNNPTTFPAGAIRIINRSPVPMAAQFSESRILTPAGGDSLIQPTTDTRGRLAFKIAIQIQQNSGDWKLIRNSITAIRAKERLLGLLIYSPSGMRHTYTADELAEMGGPPQPGCFWLTFSDTP